MLNTPPFPPLRIQDALATIYIRHLQVFRKLHAIYDLLRQPQERERLRKGLQLVAVLLLESWSSLVKANEGVDVIDLEHLLVPLKLVPDDLEICVPPALKETRQGRLQAHCRTISDAAAAGIHSPDLPGGVAELPTRDTALSGQIDPLELPKLSKSTPTALAIAASGSVTGHIHFLDRDHAATRIQSAWRRCMAMKRVNMKRHAQFAVLHMVPGEPTALASTVSKVEATVARKKARRQAEFDATHAALHGRMLQEEGPDMQLQERNAVLTFVQQHMDHATGKWPEVPLQGPLVASAAGPAASAAQPANVPETGGAKRGPAAPGKKVAAVPKGKESSSTSSTLPAGNDTASCAPSRPNVIELVLAMVEQWKAHISMSSKMGYADQNEAEVLASSELLGPDAVPLPLPRRGSSVDAVDLNKLSSEVRAAVHAQIGRAVRAETQETATAANARLPAKSFSAISGAAGKEGAGKKAAAKPAAKPGAQAAGRGGEAAAPKAPKPRDLLQGRDPAAILPELAAQGLAVAGQPAFLSDFLGEGALVDRAKATQVEGAQPPTTVKKARAGGKAANAALQSAEAVLPYPELSMAQVRQSVAVHCALPLTAHTPEVPSMQHTAVLIYGPPGCGKSLLARAVVHEAGATLFDLSPDAMRGKFPGKDADTMVHLVFRAAKAAAPAVILIDQVERIFIQDKIRAAEFLRQGEEPPCRIRRHLVEEAAALKPSDGVLIIGMSREPHAAVGADEADLLRFFQVLVKVPMPEDRTRRRILTTYAARHGVQWAAPGRPGWQQVTLAAQLTNGYTPGQLETLLWEAAAAYKESAKGAKGSSRRGVAEGAPCLVDCLIDACCKEMPVPETELLALTEWTAHAHSIMSGRGHAGGEGGADGIKGKGAAGVLSAQNRPKGK